MCVVLKERSEEDRLKCLLHTSQDRCQNTNPRGTDGAWVREDSENYGDQEEASLPACVWKIAPFILDQTLSSWYECLRWKMPDISLHWIPDLLPHFNVAARCCDLGWSELTRGEQSGSKASAHALWKQVEYKNSKAVKTVNTSNPIITCPVIKLCRLTTNKKKSISYITIYTVSFFPLFKFLFQ